MAGSIHVKQLRGSADLMNQINYVKDNLNGKLSYDAGTGNMIFTVPIQSSGTAVANDDLTNKLYVDTQISNLKGTATTNGDTLGKLETKINNLDKVTATAEQSEGTKIGSVKVGNTVTNFYLDLSSYAPLASPSFTGTPTAPTASTSVNNTQLATTKFVHDIKATILDGVTSSLDTLKKISAAINNDSAYSTTINTALGQKISFSDVTVTGGPSTANSTAGSIRIGKTTTTFGVDLTAYAPLANPELSGTPTAPTQNQDDDSTKIATTAFVARAIRNLVGASPEELNTLVEISAAINNDENFATTIANQLATKQPKHDALTSISGLSTSANKMIYTTASNVYAVASLTAFARSILDDADAATVRTTIGALGKTEKAVSATSADTAAACTGNASTATNATNDGDGHEISATYVKTANLHNLTTVTNLGWADQATGKVKAASLNSLAYWNGQSKAGTSNLAYCNQGAFGNIVTHSASDFLTKSQGNALYKPIDYAPDLSAYLLSSTAASTYLGIHAKADSAATADTATTATTCTGNAGSATELATQRFIGIKDADETNSGTGAYFKGTGDITLKLPATIKASLSGNATTASTLATKRKFKITDNDGTNSSSEVEFNGGGNVTLVLPTTLKVNISGNATYATSAGSCSGTATTATTASTCTGNSATATALKTGAAIAISDADSTNTATGVNFKGDSDITVKLPSTIKATLTGNATTANSLSTARTINGVQFDGSTNICNYGECGTAADVAVKSVTISGLASGKFTLATGSRVTVKFTVTNTASNPQLNVHSTGNKAIMYRGYNLTAAALQAGSVYDFIYDGTYWTVVGPVFWTE